MKKHFIIILVLIFIASRNILVASIQQTELVMINKAYLNILYQTVNTKNYLGFPSKKTFCTTKTACESCILTVLILITAITRFTLTKLNDQRPVIQNITIAYV